MNLPTFSFLVDGENFDLRMATCKACPSAYPVGDVTFCTRCGCAMNLKARIAGSQCPEQRWARYSVSQQPPPE